MNKQIIFLTIILLSGLMGNPIRGENLSTNNSDRIDLYGLCFSPFLHGLSPDEGDYVNESTIDTCLSIVANHTKWVRTFGMENGLNIIGKKSHSLGLKVMTGAWIDDNVTSNQLEIEDLIKTIHANETDIAVIGNEVLLRNSLSEDNLIQYIRQVKREAPSIPVTTVDIYQEIIKHPKIVDEIDVIAINIYPFWEKKAFHDAINETKRAYYEIKQKYPEKPVIISEIGWPSEGNPQGEATPSLENSKKYLNDFTTWANTEKIPYFYFEAFDESWKKTEGSVGAHWGIWDENLQMKYW